MKDILIIGDSFSADWSIKYNNYPGWPNLLANEFNIVNVSQAGCSEYKIRKQLDSVNLNEFSHCIVSHTSPNRIPVEHNPLHTNDILHHSCDFIYADVCESKNPEVASVKEYYEKYFFAEYYDYIHSLIVNDIDTVLKNRLITPLHITFFDVKHPMIDKNYHQVFKDSAGLINHLTERANKQIFQQIKNWINM